MPSVPSFGELGEPSNTVNGWRFAHQFVVTIQAADVHDNCTDSSFVFLISIFGCF